MNITEHLKCIKRINPGSHCVVMETGNGGTIAVYDKAHKGRKPTIEECEQVLDVIKGEILSEETAIISEKQRRSGIKNERDKSEFKGLSISQVYDKIDQLFSGKDTVPQLRNACADAIKLLAPFSLK